MKLNVDIGYKEAISIIVLLIFITIAIKPESFTSIIGQITKLVNSSGFSVILKIITKSI